MSAKKLTTEQFIERARAVHGDTYTYLSEYTGSRDLISITCPTHGVFNVRAYSHLEGSRCHKCDVEQRAKSNTLTNEQFLLKAKQKHGDKYTYPATYVHSNQSLEITCPRHGTFSQLPYVHLLGNGCRLCANEQITGGYTEGWFNRDDSRRLLQGTLYVLDVLSPEPFFKVGITNNLKQRLPHYPKFLEYTVLSTVDMLLYDAFTLEQHILTQYEEYQYRPSFVFGGHTECFMKTLPVKEILKDVCQSRLTLEAN